MLMRLHRRRWEALATADPLWAVLSDPNRRGGGWDADEFFASGESQIGDLMRRLDAIGAAPTPMRALDFGCGAGRLTRALAARFQETHGIDISPSMIALAERHNRFPGRCRFATWDGRRLPFPDDHFDLAATFITLQHMPPRAARTVLRELGRVLRPGGALAFQAAAEPTRRRRWSARILPRTLYELAREIKSVLAPAPDFEMYGLPRPLVERLLAKQGLRLLAADADAAAGPGWMSFTYIAVKPARA